MIEGIRSIGKIRLGKDKEDKIMECLLEDVPKPKKENEKLHLVILNYNTFDRKIEVDVEEIGEDTAMKYLWLGTLPGNEDQLFITVSNIDYLISQTIPNLAKRVSSEGDFSKTLNRVIQSMFYDLELQGRCRFILDLEKCGVAKKGYMKEIREKVERLKEQGIKDADAFKEIIKDVRAKIDYFISQQPPYLKKKEIGLYTLKINDKLMAEDKEYQRIVIEKKIDSLFEENRRGICSLCNEYKIITEKPKFTKAGSALGYYITDKVGFSCELSGDFSKNFILCRDCYMCLLAGETFVRNRLKSNIGGLSVYIIPKFIMPMSFSFEKLQNWAEYINASFNSFRSLIGLREFEERLREYMEFEEIKNSFILNLLFWKKGIGAEFKILKLIKDVPPSRIELLQRVGNQIKDIADQLLGEANQWKIDLQGIYYLIPLRRTKVEIIEYRKLLQLYDAIFSAKPVSYKFLIQQFVELAGVYRFEKFDVYNIGRQQPDLGIAYSMLKANILLLYLKRLTILTGGGGNMDYANLDVDEGMRNFVREMEYDEPKVALFLLGYLIGEIGNAQYREGNSKPILGKITYQGMNQNKLVRLLNDVFEKLTQYKSGGKPLLHYSEGIFAECKRLLDKTIQKPLSDQENVFYVLSGYAYATHQAIKASQSKEAKKEEEVETNE